VSQNGEQNGVFEDVGVVPGVEGVAITEHAWMVTAPALRAFSSAPPECCHRLGKEGKKMN
jgi:hypothetical protein